MTEINHADRAHSSLVGGSTAKRRLNCPASYQMEQQVPKSPTSDYAEEGTACHEAMTEILEKNLSADDIVGKQYNGFVMNKKRVAETVAPALRFFDELCDELEVEGGLEFMVEQRLQFPGIPDAFGTGDVVGRTDKRSLVLDWKFGGGVPVEAKRNEQGMFYARAAMFSYPEMFEKDDDWPVEIIIAQPRLDSFERWPTTVRELNEFRQKLTAAVADATSDNPTLAEEIGPWCDFAACKAICPLWTKPVARTAELAATINPKELDLAALGQYYSDVLALAEFVEPLFAEVRKQAHQFLQDGGQIADWYLGEKRATRSFVDETKAARVLSKQGIPTVDMYVSKFVSPAQAEKLLKAAGKSPDVIKDVVQSVSSGTTLARKGSTHKPAITTAEQAKQLAQRLGFNKEN